MTIRLSMSSLAGTARTLVAVGTVRLAAMFCAVRAAAPRSLLTSASVGVGVAGAWPAGFGRASAGALGGGRLGRDRLRPGTVLPADRAVVGEERPPRLVDRAWVVEVSLVQLVDQPLVGAEVGGGRRGGPLCRFRGLSL